MSDAGGTDGAASPAAKPKVAEKDRVKLPPVPKGWVRGRVTTVIATVERTEMGLRTTHTITIQPAKPAAPVTFTLSGLTIQRKLRENELVQVFRGDAAEEPFPVARIVLPINGASVEAFDGARPPAAPGLAARFGVTAMVAGPVIAVVAFLLLAWFYWRIYR